MAALAFGCAGTLDYRQAWVFLGVFTALSLAITVYLMKNDPGLLERRVRGGPGAEKEAGQKIAMSFASLGFIASPRCCGGFSMRRRFSRAALPVTRNIGTASNIGSCRSCGSGYIRKMPNVVGCGGA